MRCSPPRCSPGSSRWRRGSAPSGLRNLSAYALRYGARVNGYILLLTDAYPHASPLEGVPEPQLALEITPRRASARRPGVSRGHIARAALLLAFAALWSVAAYLLWQSARAVVAAPSARRGRPLLSPRRSCTRPASYGRFHQRRLDRWTVIVELVVFVLYAALGRALRPRVGGGADRHRNAARDDRLRAGCGWRRCRSPSPALWWERRHHLTHTGYFTTVFGELARARQPVRLPLPRAGDRDGAPAPPRELVVAAGGAGVRRARRRCPRSSRRTCCRRIRCTIRRCGARRARSSGSSTCSTRRSSSQNVHDRHVAAERRGDGARAEPARRDLGHAARRAVHRPASCGS